MNTARRTTVRAAAAAAASLALAPLAYAHAFLAKATPAVGSVVHQAPAEVAITFTESVEPLFTTIAVTNAAGAHVEAGAAHQQADATHMAVALKPLAPGAYTVTWHAVAVDTHKTQGHFTFTVAP